MPENLISALFAIIAPVFLIASVGFYWAKSGRPYDINQMTPIITYVGTPCLVLSSLLQVEISYGALIEVAAISAIAIFIFAVFGYLILKIAGLPYEPYLPGLMFSNCGNMGLPLCLLAFGQEGLALAVAYFAVSAISQFTIGQAIASGQASLLKLLKTPMVWAVILALILMTSKTALPLWAANTIKLAGQFTIPLMLLTLGVSLSRLQVKTLGRSGLLACLRVGGGLVVGYLLAWAFDLDGAVRGVVILQSAMPVAVFNYLFAQLHNNRPEEVAGMVVLSTALSFITLPFLLAFLI